jgi:hypothetical protein
MLCTLAYFGFPGVGSAGVGIPARIGSPQSGLQRGSLSIWRAGPRTDLRDRGGGDFFPKLAPGSGGSVHENGCCAGHVVPHGGGGLLRVTGFDRVDDVRMPFDIHVFQRAIHPGEHD